MGLFDSFLAIHHRVAALKVRDFALSLETSDRERAVAALLGVELYRYVAERTYLLPALARYMLHVRAEETNLEDIRAASGFLERVLDEYFATRPGVDANVSTYHWHIARDDYLLSTPDRLATTFLIRVTDARLNSEHVLAVPGYMDLIATHIANTAQVVHAATARLR